MSQSASQTTIFYRDVEISQKVWSIADAGGFPVSKNRDGIKSMPFWSSKSRAELIIKNVAAYNGFEPVEMDINEFYDWLKTLKKSGELAGINWSGKMAKGYDLNPETLIRWIDAHRPKKSFWKRLL